jgi:ABC-2 type transport system permease protein
MIRIFDIASKDLLQLLRDRKTFLFLLIMPIAFTFLFGFAFGGFGGSADPRLPVGYLDLDNSKLSRLLHDQLVGSDVIHVRENLFQTPSWLAAQVADEKLAAAIIVPQGYGHKLLFGKPVKLTLLADTNTTAGMSVESETLSAVLRLQSALNTAVILEQLAGDKAPFDYSLSEALSRWKQPPIRISETTSSAIHEETGSAATLAHTSPGMMLQFAIAVLLTTAQVLVAERKSRALARLLTTATLRVHILLGHYLANLTLILSQFILLIVFGQFVLGVGYLRSPAGTALVALSAAVCVAALGLLIGVMAHSDEQAIIFSLVPMFVLAGLGGAWVPLEVTSPAFQVIGHATPLAWALDGFKDITIRGLGIASIFKPALILFGYAVVFFSLATWRFRRTEV